MIDLHCHILPQVDDGPSAIGESLLMAKKAVEDGITQLIATPHHLNGLFCNPKQHILPKVSEFNRILVQAQIPLKVYPGQEVRLHRELFISLAKDEVLTIGSEDRFLLLELPTDDVPLYTNEYIYELLLKGITPIIVHPERNMKLIEEPHLLFEAVQEGALVQLTAGSVIGHFGRKVKRFSEQVIQHRLAHFIASDAHNISKRGFTLLEAYGQIAKTYGVQQMYLLKENVELLMLGQRPQADEPLPFRKKILGIF